MYPDEWLPNASECENGLAKVIVLFPERRKRVKDADLRVPKVVTDVAMAEEFQPLLDARELRNRAGLARRFRLARARVTQLMKLLILHPVILAYVKSLPPGTPTKMVTECGLRALAWLRQDHQVAAAKRCLRGFDPAGAILGAEMAKSKKEARNIVVQDVKYRWRATGNDGWISLVVWPDDLPGPTIACSLDYHHTSTPMGNGVTALTQQIVVTNRIVRQVIEYAVREFDYDPHTKGKQVNHRHVDKAIDLSNAVRSA